MAKKLNTILLAIFVAGLVLTLVSGMQYAVARLNNPTFIDTSVYLPLTGGTLTGNLIGTNASFSSSLELTAAASKLGINAGVVTDTMLEVGGTASATTFIGGLASHQFKGDIALIDGDHLYGDTVNTHLALSSTAGTHLGFGSGSNHTHITLTNNVLQFTTSGAGEILRFNTTGIGVGTTAPGAKLDIKGDVIFREGLQVAHTATTSYSRFGTSTTTHSNYITAADDLLISGDLEIRGSTTFEGVASVSGRVFMDNLTVQSGSGNVLCVLSTGEIVQDDSPTVACSGLSSLRVKENIKYIDNVENLKDVLALKPVTYRFKEDYKPFDRTTHIGLIAEDVATVDRLLIEEDGNGLLGLKYVEIIPKLIGAIKAQQQEIEELKKSGVATSSESSNARYLGLLGLLGFVPFLRKK